MQDETLDPLEVKKPELPGSFKIFSTLAYIGNAFWGLVFIIFFLLIVTNSSALSNYIVVEDEYLGLVSAIYFLAILLCVIPFVGIVKMARQQQAGFWMYALPNVLWVAYCFWLRNNGTIGIGIVSIIFIFIFASYLKYMKK